MHVREFQTTVRTDCRRRGQGTVTSRAVFRRPNGGTRPPLPIQPDLDPPTPNRRHELAYQRADVAGAVPKSTAA